MSNRTGVGVLHHCCAELPLDINGIIVALEQAVVIEHSARTRGGDHGDPRSLVIARRRTTRARRSVAAGGSEAGKCDGAASLYGHTGNGRRRTSPLSGTAGTGVRRDPGP